MMNDMTKNFQSKESKKKFYAGRFYKNDEKKKFQNFLKMPFHFLSFYFLIILEKKNEL